MISVKKTLKAIVNKFQQKPELLWTNSTPTATFAAKTITLSKSLSNYKYYDIHFKQNTGDNRIFVQRFTVGSGFHIFFSYSVTQYRSSNAVPSGTSMKFDNAYEGNAGAQAMDNNKIIPVAVYGIK